MGIEGDDPSELPLPVLSYRLKKVEQKTDTMETKLNTLQRSTDAIPTLINERFEQTARQIEQKGKSSKDERRAHSTLVISTIAAFAAVGAVFVTAIAAVFNHH